jgi:hypothetical protein
VVQDRLYLWLIVDWRKLKEAKGIEVGVLKLFGLKHNNHAEEGVWVRMWMPLIGWHRDA